MGSCMAHLNCFPARAAGVNFWFFVAVPCGGGCWYKAKCEMLLCKIDGEKNVQNFRFSVKLWNGDCGNMLHDQRQWQLSRTRTVIFLRYDMSPTSKSHRWWSGNPNGRSKFRNLFVYVSKIASNAPAAAPRLMAADGDHSNRCRRRKHCRRRPGDDRDRSKFCNYENLCLQDQAKPLEKHLFAVFRFRDSSSLSWWFFHERALYKCHYLLRSPLLWWHCALCISYYHSQQLLFSPT